MKVPGGHHIISKFAAEGIENVEIVSIGPKFIDISGWPSAFSIDREIYLKASPQLIRKTIIKERTAKIVLFMILRNDLLKKHRHRKC